LLGRRVGRDRLAPSGPWGPTPGQRFGLCGLVVAVYAVRSRGHCPREPRGVNSE